MTYETVPERCQIYHNFLPPEFFCSFIKITRFYVPQRCRVDESQKKIIPELWIFRKQKSLPLRLEGWGLPQGRSITCNRIDPESHTSTDCFRYDVREKNTQIFRFWKKSVLLRRRGVNFFPEAVNDLYLLDNVARQKRRKVWSEKAKNGSGWEIKNRRGPPLVAKGERRTRASNDSYLRKTKSHTRNVSNPPMAENYALLFVNFWDNICSLA